MAIELDIKVGDVVLGGKFKNKRIVVKTIGKDDLGQPTINGMSLLKMRIEKLLPPEKQSKETREEANTDMKKTVKEQVGTSLTREMAVEYNDLEAKATDIAHNDYSKYPEYRPGPGSNLYVWRDELNQELKRLNKRQNEIIRSSGARNLTEFDNLLRATLRNTTTRESKMKAITKLQLEKMIQETVKEAVLREQSFSKEDSNVRVEDAYEGLENAMADLQRALPKLQDQELKALLADALTQTRGAYAAVEKYIRLRQKKSSELSSQSMSMNTDNHKRPKNFIRNQRGFDRAIQDYGISPEETSVEELYQTLVDDGFVDTNDSNSVDAAEMAIEDFMGQY